MFKISATIPLQYDTGFSPFFASEFDEALAWLHKNGFHGIEICISEPKKVNIEELKKKLSQYNLEISVISTGQARTLEGISLTDNDEQIRMKAKARVKEHIELSAKIGFPIVTIGLLRGLGSLEKRDEQLSWLKEAMEECGSLAIEKGVRLMIEPINRYETALLNSLQETMDFVASLKNSENIGILLDTFHSNIEDPDICAAIKSAKEKLFHVHFADSNRWLPGFGHLNFKAIIETLREIEYMGYVSLETLNLPDRKTVKEKAFESIAQYLDTANIGH